MFKLEKPLTPEIRQYLSTALSTGRVRDPRWRIALAVVVAKAIPMDRCEDPRAYFRETLRSSVSIMLNDLLSVVPFAVEGMLDLVENFWLARYNAAWGKCNVVLNNENGILDILGITRNLDIESIKMLQPVDQAQRQSLNYDIDVLRALVELFDLPVKVS